jgi:MoxR-like ATPase
MEFDEAAALTTRLLDRLDEVVVTDRSFLETVITGVVGGGHILLEDVPGTGKTLTARSVADVLGLEFSRVQFTPDLLPGDVTGSNVFNEKDREFEFNEGPIFANIVLADEINRAPPKTQSALLEAMEEEQVTVDGETYPLPDPFFVIATQNPVEQEGTFPLPEAQVDRFWIKTAMGYPPREDEVEILLRRGGRDTATPEAEQLVAPGTVRSLQALPERVEVHPDLCGYMIELAQATRDRDEVEVGVSPRGAQRLYEMARAWAVLQGRAFVIPADVKRVAPDVLTHRVSLVPEARVQGRTADETVTAVLDSAPVPDIDPADGEPTGQD